MNFMPFDFAQDNTSCLQIWRAKSKTVSEKDVQKGIKTQQRNNLRVIIKNFGKI